MPPRYFFSVRYFPEGTWTVSARSVWLGPSLIWLSLSKLSHTVERRSGTETARPITVDGTRRGLDKAKWHRSNAMKSKDVWRVSRQTSYTSTIRDSVKSITARRLKLSRIVDISFGPNDSPLRCFCSHNPLTPSTLSDDRCWSTLLTSVHETSLRSSFRAFWGLMSIWKNCC